MNFIPAVYKLFMIAIYTSILRCTIHTLKEADKNACMESEKY